MKRAKRVLALVGSPRVRGNTDILVTELLRGAKDAGARTKKIYLNRLKITPCQACYRCLKTGRCPIDDDMQRLYDLIYDADAIVFGTPIYWWTVSAQTKLCLDRWFAFLDADYNSRIKGKSAAVIAVCADPGVREMTAGALHLFKESLNFLGIKWKGSVIAAAHEKGEVASNATAMQRAKELGARLVS